MQRVIVFDLFHTLIDPEPYRPIGHDRMRAIAATSGLHHDRLTEYWTNTYLERETTTIDLVDLVQRHASLEGIELTERQRSTLDVLFGDVEDRAMLEPDDALVTLVRALAEVFPVGVLSNCHEREVRNWASSPYAPHVKAFGRSSRIGSMKPDQAAYDWITDALGADPAESIYVGNGSSGELVGARKAGFDTIVHCNTFDRLHNLVSPSEQRRRSLQADVSVDSTAELTLTLERLVSTRNRR